MFSFESVLALFKFVFSIASGLVWLVGCFLDTAFFVLGALCFQFTNFSSELLKSLDEEMTEEGRLEVVSQNLVKSLLMALTCAFGTFFFIYYSIAIFAVFVRFVYNACSDTVNTFFLVVSAVFGFLSALFNRVRKTTANARVYIDIAKNWINSRLENPFSDSRTIRTHNTPISTIIRDLPYGVWYDLKEIELHRPVFAAFKAAPEAGWSHTFVHSRLVNHVEFADLFKLKYAYDTIQVSHAIPLTRCLPQYSTFLDADIINSRARDAGIQNWTYSGSCHPLKADQNPRLKFYNEDFEHRIRTKINQDLDIIASDKIKFSSALTFDGASESEYRKPEKAFDNTNNKQKNNQPQKPQPPTQQKAHGGKGLRASLTDPNTAKALASAANLKKKNLPPAPHANHVTFGPAVPKAGPAKVPAFTPPNTSNQRFVPPKSQ